LTTFTDLGLSDEVLKVLAELGFEKPTEIQAQSIPQLLEDERDFIGLAQTGTGKTAAFGLPLLERIDPFNKSTQALVLAPTRELGQQIAEQLHTFSKYLDKVNVLAVYGGQAISTQIRALKKPQQIIIATPGRLIDLIKRKAVKLGQVQFLVLDEADEMLNMGFKDELDEILSYTPEDKLTWLFSATMPKEIKRIVNTYMDDPLEVKIDAKNQVNTNIEHQFVMVRQPDKQEALVRFLDSNPDMRGLVFCRTRRDTQNLAEELLKQNYKADALHGDLSQVQRDRVMKRFKAHHLKVLIATDVAARGIDVNDLTHVFHYTLPEDMSYYTHRSGRTARAGKEGISIAFVNGREKFRINRLQKNLGITFNQVMIPSIEEIASIRVENWCGTLLNQKVNHKIEQGIIDKVQVFFEDLPKDTLIHKLLSKEFESMNLHSTRDLNDKIRTSKEGNRRDRNDRRRDRNDRKRGNKRDNNRNERNRNKDRREKSEFSRNKRKDKFSKKEDGQFKKGRKTRNNSDKPRFFINLGKRDEIAKQDLLDFICRVGQINKSDVGTIELQKSHSYFEVDAKAAPRLGQMICSQLVLYQIIIAYNQIP